MTSVGQRLLHTSGWGDMQQAVVPLSFRLERSGVEKSPFSMVQAHLGGKFQGSEFQNR